VSGFLRWYFGGLTNSRNLQGCSLAIAGATWSAPSQVSWETCATLGIYTHGARSQAAVENAGWMCTTTRDTSPAILRSISTSGRCGPHPTRWRLHASPGLKVCCGGIVGMGEQVEDRLGISPPFCEFARAIPTAFPITMLNEVKGFPFP